MEEILKADSKNLFDEFKAKRGDKIKAVDWSRIESGEYFSGTEAVNSGLADSFGTIQKALIKEFPEAKLYYVPLADRKLLDRRYFNRSIKNGKTL